MVYVIQLASRIRAFRQLSANLYDIYHCCMYSAKPLMMDRNCPKHLEFYSKIKFEKLVHLVGFIISIYHDARSPERQMEKPMHMSSFLPSKIPDRFC